MGASVAKISMVVLALTFLASLSEGAETGAVPPHLAQMAATLYKQVEHTLGEEKGKDEEHTAVQRRALDILRRAGVHRWGAGKAILKGLVADTAKRLEIDLASKAGEKAVHAALAAKEGDYELAAKAVAAARGKQPSAEELQKMASEVSKAVGEARASLSRSASLETREGETVELKWRPEIDRFYITVDDKSQGEGASGNMSTVTTLSSNVKQDFADNGRDMVIDVEADEKPVRITTPKDLVELCKNVLGDWETDDGTVYRFAAASKEAGEVVVPAEYYDKKIEELKKKLEKLRSGRIYIWENPETGELVQQSKFRRLKEPFEYQGEDYKDPDAEEKMAEIEAEIRELKAQRAGVDRPPMDQYDPVSFGSGEQTGVMRPIQVSVYPRNCPSFRHVKASFNGRIIKAKRTITNVEHLKPELPLVVKQDLVRSWSPPEWIELEADIDIETGELILSGQRWHLHVTWSSFFGEYQGIDGIHTPYAKPLVMRRGSTRLKVAPGADGETLP